MSSVRASIVSSSATLRRKFAGVSIPRASKTDGSTLRRGCVKSPAIIPDRAFWLICQTRKTLTSKSRATCDLLFFPSQYSRIAMHSTCARSFCSWGALSHRPRTGQAGFGAFLKSDRLRPVRARRAFFVS